MFVMVFGGLRGAVGLALALILQLTEDIDQEVRNQVTFQVIGIVGMTLMFNGTAAPYVFPRIIGGHRKLPMRLAKKSAKAVDDEVLSHKALLKAQPRFLRVGAAAA